MEWFSAMMFFAAKVEGEAPADALFKDSIRVFRARGHAHAAVRAQEVGRAAAHDAQDADGRSVQWLFSKVIEVIGLNEQTFEDGTEVFWIWEEREHEDDPTWTGAQAPKKSAEVSDPPADWGALDLNWFCAQISSVCRVDGQLPSTLAESYRVFRARDLAHAIQRAPEVGLLEETSYLNYLGETVRWTFEGVDEVQALGVSTLEEGVEVFAFVHRDDPRQETPDPSDAQAPDAAD